MATYYTTTAILGLGLAATILWLLRRDHLHLGHGLFWLFVAVLAGVLGLWPWTIDYAAKLMGVSYPPSFLLLLAVVVLLVKTLHTDILNTRIERQVRRLNQKLVLIDSDLQRESPAGYGSDAVQRESVKQCASVDTESTKVATSRAT